MSDHKESWTEISITPKREWVTPSVTDLPRLVDLTLQTGSGIPGGGDVGGGGSTVIP